MQPIHRQRSSLKASTPALILLLTGLVLPGCACLEDEWHTYVNWDADAAEYGDEPDCSFEGIEKRSKETAALAENADPKLLAEARREAERACARSHASSPSESNQSDWRTQLK